MPGYGVRLRQRTAICVVSAVCALSVTPAAIAQVGPSGPPMTQPQVPLVAGAVAYTASTGHGSDTRLMITDPGGTRTAFDGAASNTQPTWSPDGYTVAFLSGVDHFDYGGYLRPQIYLVNRDGSGLHRITEPSIGFIRDPSWAPDGSAIAYTFTYADVERSVIDLVSTDGSQGTSVTDASDFQAATPAWSVDGEQLAYACRPTPEDAWSLCRINADGSGHDVMLAGTRPQSLAWRGDHVLFAATIGDTSGCWSLTVGTTTPGQVGSGLCAPGLSSDENVQMSGGSGVQVAYAGTVVGQLQGTGSDLVQDVALASGETVLGSPVVASPPTIDSLRVGAPRAADRVLTRQLHIGVSYNNSLVDHFEFGWSPLKSAKAPSGIIQRSPTDVAVLDFGPTSPDADWYLFARAVLVGGSATTWTKPKKVHTPPKGAVVAVGDSYASGHHQDTDDGLCPLPEDVPAWLAVTGIPAYCAAEGRPTDVVFNDAAFSWPCRLADLMSAGLPTNWRMDCVNYAQSGAPAASYGNAQIGLMRDELNRRSKSWDVLAISGGADDIDFKSTLRDYYIANPAGTKPWEVEDWKSCPDQKQELWQRASDKSTQAAILTALNNAIKTAVQAARGVRIVDVMYPYTVDSGNPCYGNHTIAKKQVWHGQKDIVDILDKLHERLRPYAQRLIKLDLRTEPAFCGGQSVASGQIQLTRLYGYPHPSNAGQDSIASLALLRLGA